MRHYQAQIGRAAQQAIRLQFGEYIRRRRNERFVRTARNRGDGRAVWAHDHHEVNLQLIGDGDVGQVRLGIFRIAVLEELERVVPVAPVRVAVGELIDEPVNDIRDRLMFGESNIGDAGHEGHNKAAAMADTDEVCGCNGVTKGAICKAIKDKGLFTLDEVRKHTKASASCGSCTGLVEQLLMFTAGGDYSKAPTKKAMCGCTDASHEDARQAIREIYEDLARSANFDGLLFHDDVTLSDYEDASPEALRTYQSWGLPASVACNAVRRIPVASPAQRSEARMRSSRSPTARLPFLTSVAGMKRPQSRPTNSGAGP